MPITYVQPLSATIPVLNSLNGERNILTYDHILLCTTDYPGAGNSDGAVYVFDRNSGTGKYNQVQLLTGPAGSGNLYGNSAAVNTNFIYVGAPGATSNQGAVYEINNTGGSRFTVNQTITGPNRGRRGALGTSMKLVDSSNLFIGAMLAEPRNTGIKSGAIYHYVKSGTWGYTATLSSSNAGDSEEFGFSFDGNTSEILAGSPQWNTGQGRVYLMNPNPSDTNAWLNTQIITLNGTGNNGPHQGQPGDLFGFKVIKGSNYAFISAPRYKINVPNPPALGPGAVFMYQKSGLFWTFVSILTADSSFSPYSRLEFGVSMAYNEANNYILIGADATNGGRGLVFGFDVSNPFNPQQVFQINRPVVVPGSYFGHNVQLLPSSDNGTALIGSYGAVVSPDDGSIYPPNAGAAFLFNEVNNFVVTPSPTITPTVTPSPTPAPTPVLKPSDWYGLNPLDPISVGDGGGPAGTDYSRYPKTPALGGPGRNYSILREIGALFVDNPGIYSFSTFRGSLYNLAVSYSSWCLNNGLNAANPTAMSEFHRSRGISLGFTYTLENRPVTQSKYCDSANGGVRLRIIYYSGPNRYGNPIRTTTYTFTIGANTSLGSVVNVGGTNYLQFEVGGLSPVAQNWSIVDNSTGYTRSGTITVGCGTNSYVIADSQDYKQQFPRNPPS